MADSHAATIVAEILLAWRASHANYDLSTVSSTPKVVLDEDLPPMVSVPWVSLGSPSPIEIEGDAITPLTQYKVRGTLIWAGFVAGLTDSTEARAGAALKLARDLVLALQTAQTVPGTYPTLAACLEIRQKIEGVRGDSSGDGVSFGMVVGEIVYESIIAGGV